MSERKELSAKLRAMIQKSTRSIRAAQRHLEEEDYDFASSRAYYTAFYAMQAALLTKGLSFSKHSAVISAFSQHFIRTQVFPREFGALISRLFRERQTGDYEFDASIAEEDARKDVQIAETILQTIVTYLTKEGFLHSSS